MNDVLLSYGEKAVGLTFNPSADANVEKIKRLYAEIIDRMNDWRTGSTSTEASRLASIAITEAQASQMFAVKSFTWQD